MSMNSSRNLAGTNGLKKIRKEKVDTGGAAFTSPTKRYSVSRRLLVDDFDREAIRRKIYHLYQTKQHVTLSKLLVELKEDNLFRGQIQKNTGDYHDEMTADHFEEWFATKLLPNVPANSLIVMDNATYHSCRSDPVPVKSWTKKKDARLASGKGN